MTAERESMTLQEMDAPALGVEERACRATTRPFSIPSAITERTVSMLF